MFPLIVVALLTLIFLLVGCLVWLGAVLLGIRGKGKRIFKRSLICLAVFLPVFLFVLCPLVLSHLLAGASTRPQDQKSLLTPASYGAHFSDVEFSSRDGVMLRGWLLEGLEGKPAMILAHGLFRNRQEPLERACVFNKAGYTTLLFDFRNHGSSGRRHVSLGFGERLDVLGAYDFLKAKGKQSFVLMGVSMGAVAVIHAASEFQQDLIAIIADSPFENLERTVSHHTNLFLNLPSFPFQDLFVWNLSRIGGFRPKELDTLRALRQAEVPVLLIYGDGDRRIPKSTAQAILEAVRHIKKRLVFFKGATHGAAYRSNSELYRATVLDFLRLGQL